MGGRTSIRPVNQSGLCNLLDSGMAPPNTGASAGPVRAAACVPRPRSPSMSFQTSPISPSAAAAPSWWREPWVIVLGGGLIMGLSLGVRYVQGLFQLPIVGDRGWTRESFAFALAIQNLAWGVAQPLTGMIADRFGAARVI